jgi:hypothetical protein
MHATVNAYRIFLGLIISIFAKGKTYKLWRFLPIFLEPVVIPSLLGPNIRLSTPFSKTLNVC